VNLLVFNGIQNYELESAFLIGPAKVGANNLPNTKPAYRPIVRYPNYVARRQVTLFVAPLNDIACFSQQVAKSKIAICIEFYCPVGQGF
jgi:hypothetical protein